MAGVLVTLGKWPVDTPPYHQGVGGEINYNLTQFLAGNGGYEQYFYRFKLDNSLNCPNCEGVPQDPEHVLFHCPRFMDE